MRFQVPYYKLIEVNDTYANVNGKERKENLTVQRDTTNQATTLGDNESLLRVYLFASSNGPEPGSLVQHARRHDG